MHCLIFATTHVTSAIIGNPPFAWRLIATQTPEGSTRTSQHLHTARLGGSNYKRRLSRPIMLAATDCGRQRNGLTSLRPWIKQALYIGVNGPWPIEPSRGVVVDRFIVPILSCIIAGIAKYHAAP